MSDRNAYAHWLVVVNPQRPFMRFPNVIKCAAGRVDNQNLIDNIPDEGLDGVERVTQKPLVLVTMTRDTIVMLSLVPFERALSSTSR